MASSILSIGLQAARRNLVPMFALWGLSLSLVAAYYAVKGFSGALTVAASIAGVSWLWRVKRIQPAGTVVGALPIGVGFGDSGVALVRQGPENGNSGNLGTVL